MMEENKEEKIVPNYALDLINANHNATQKKLWILVFVLVVLLAASNAGWIIYENSFVDSITVSQDTPNGNNNYIGHDGDITNGTTDDN